MIDRRGFLRVGSIAGLSLAQALRLQAAQPGESRRRDVNCIFIFTLGGANEPGEVQDSHMGTPMYTATLGIPRTLALLSESECVCRGASSRQD